MSQPTDRSLAAATEVFRSRDGILRTSEALAAGIQARTLYWMRDEGLLERLSRGVYHLADHPLPPQPSVAAVMQRVPSAVLCLVSALEFHEIGTQIPAEVQIALPRGVKAPRIDYPRVRVFHMNAECIAAGVEVHRIAGTKVRVFNIAKTAADCFKYRNRIGADVAIEALQEVVRDRRATPGEIMRYAQIDRIATTIRPYLEALL